MKEITLDAEKMKTRQEAHSYLKQMLDFPDYYGENLDALNDCLGEICEATLIHIPAILSADNYLADYGDTMLQVFRQAAAENDRLIVTIE